MTRNMDIMISPIDGGTRPITPKTICANGSVVGLVAVRVRAGEFFAYPDRWNGVVTSR